MRVIGLDCATEDAKIGLALGEYESASVLVSTVQVCSRERRAASTIAGWLAGATDALLAIDAPLGWPISLGRVLANHKAGEALSVLPNEMFRRETDRFVQLEIGKTPLDV